LLGGGFVEYLSLGRILVSMKKQWKDPVKDQDARPETLAIEGDFGKFTAFMQELVKVPSQKEKRKPISSPSSPGPASS
jgi:hypothetical protein